MLPISQSLALAVVFTIGIVDLALGLGVLARTRVALYGMVLRSAIAVPFDYLTSRAGYPGGALVGLGANGFIVWALLRPDSRRWFGRRQQCDSRSRDRRR